ncbi:hypothetical protein GCM10011322_09890 [Salinarimonas ramus]|uniref:Uncharacterized protein n=1 Tax=Salinarimonas ramus TaxID=690164 RepID=A0A917Q4Z8_9HYPH|nr:hypothetical protein GCM10011322_09890 [Salinarimonas ramus]
MRHDAQRTVRPFGLKCAGSMTYSLAQDGQVISMANQVGRAPLGAGAALPLASVSVKGA